MSDFSRRPSMTDLIALAMNNTIESNRAMLDHMTGASQITFIVNMDTKRGVPRQVRLRPEIITGADDPNDHHE